jgi:hypothetical protein
MPVGYCVVGEARCNWYLLDINIYSLSKKSRAMVLLNSFTKVGRGGVAEGASKIGLEPRLLAALFYLFFKSIF